VTSARKEPEATGSPYVGEIRVVGFNFQAIGWVFCDGRLLPISQFGALFNLIGTTYGGDGQTTFGVPDLRSRVPLHIGSNGVTNYVLGQSGGVENVTLTTAQLPQHSHVPAASSGAGTSTSPLNGFWAAWGNAPYSTSPPNVSMDATGIGMTGGSQPHENLPPVLALNFVISLFGIFPSQS
jgi:microcystin-dependent protein